MDSQQPRRRIPQIQFRVLIIGRANAGKTTILQRVCETTESPITYRGNEQVKLDPTMERGEHRIDDELVFSNHQGYVFHDSRGIESGSIEELGILQDFIRRKCGEKKLRDRLHAIWYCVPMDNQRPQLDLKFYKDICPDQNVPVLAVFTKYDQFLRNVEMHLVDYPDEFCHLDNRVSQVAEHQFQEQYLHSLGDDPRFVRLEKMHRENRRCEELIEKTASALNDDIVALMLLAVQKDSLEFSVKIALNRAHSFAGFEVKRIVRECLIPFPYIWLFEPGEPGGESFPEDFSFDLPFSLENHFTTQVTSLPTIKNLITGPQHHHLIIAIILILKHATFLRLSNLNLSTAETALAQAELDYQEAKMDLKVQQHLAVSSQEHTAELSAGFILASDFARPQSLLRTRTQRKDNWFRRRFWEQLRRTERKDE